MDRQFGLPVAFAAAAHAALLFAFDKSPRAALVGLEKTTYTEFRLMPDPPEPVVIESDSVVREAAPPPDAPRPTLAEPPPIALDSTFHLPPPPLQPVSTREVMKIALENLIGDDPDGKKWAGTGVIPQHLLDNSPRTRLQPAPIYPLEGKKEGLRGEVVVEFLVDEQGRVRDPRVMSSTHRMFEEPTLRAIAKWVFEPGRRDGRVVSFKMAVPVIFNLNE